MTHLIQSACRHLSENGMTYRQHAAFAIGCAWLCAATAVLLAVHAALPCFHQRAGAKLTRRLREHFVD